jgi:primosomal protein N' (replication factor Y) (superfamily II helicase)
VPSSTSGTDTIVAVAVPVPGLGLLRYRVPPPAPAPPKGARVIVPLGGRTVTGCVVETPVHDLIPEKGIKDILEVVDDGPFLPEAVVDLALWVGDYYASGPGEALAVAMPPAARGGRRASFKTTQVAELDATAPAETRTPGTKQKLALDLLRGRAGGMTLPELMRAGVSTATVRSLVRSGHLRLREEIVERDPFATSADRGGNWSIDRDPDAGRELTAEQSEVLARLQTEAASGEFRVTLLHGVTGSGKTEVYLRLAGQIVRSGRRVLMLVPEIALTPAVAGTFRAHFGARVAIQHSGLSIGERHDQWHRIRDGHIDVVVGTRSAIFAPLERIGLIVVDEEHEASYKQEEVPRYHGRDVAVVRGRTEGALVVLGSATPSLESSANAHAGRYGLLKLTRRILDRPLASVRIVDMRPEYAARGADVTLSAALVEAIADRLDKREQSLVLLNRRGFATVIFCRQCGASLECPHCSVALTYHRGVRRVRCHYCNYASAVPKACGICGGTFLEQSGFGTERLEADLREAFPGARVTRVDRDTVRRRGSIARVLTAVARGEIDILVGTQIIAKGHDFPAVTLVGVVSADVGLGLADFRAGERAFQLLTQVVGRAGRGEVPGEAIIQTLYPDHYSIRAAAAQDYETFFAREMQFRTSLHYPPAVSLINVVIHASTLDKAMTDASDLVDRVRQHGLQGKVIGPAPAALARIKDEHRVQFFIKGRGRKSMRAALDAALAARPDLRRRTIVDVDPVSVL